MHFHCFGSLSQSTPDGTGFPRASAVHVLAVADPQNTVRVLARHFKADPVVADAQTQVADFLERLDFPFAALGEIRKGLKDAESLFAVHAPELLFRRISPYEVAQRPNSRSKSSWGVPGTASRRATSAFRAFLFALRFIVRWRVQ